MFLRSSIAGLATFGPYPVIGGQVTEAFQRAMSTNRFFAFGKGMGEKGMGGKKIEGNGREGRVEGREGTFPTSGSLVCIGLELRESREFLWLQCLIHST